MTWSFLGRRALSYGERTGGTTIERPVGALTNCLLIPVFEFTPSPPSTFTSNFTTRLNTLYNSSGDRLVVLDKIDDGSQKFEMSWTGAKKCQGWLYAFSGNATGEYFDTGSALANETAEKLIKTTGVTVGKAGSLLINAS